jgi:predicted porin
MNKKLGLAVAGALVALSSSANAGITIPAGDWTVDVSGNVNAFYNHSSGSGTANNTNTINTGLLPAAIGIGAKTRQNDLDIAFQFTFFTGIDSTNNPVSAGAHGYGPNAALGMNSLNIRQAYMTIGDASWGQIKLGRDLGIFESDAILSDMTLLGVGAGGAGTGNTTLGRIGYGYMYADWKTQIQYQTPNWNGFQVTGAVDTPWQATGGSYACDAYLGGNFGGTTSQSGGNGGRCNQGAVGNNKNMGFEGKVTYDFAANDVTGRVWLGGIVQKVQGKSVNTVSNTITNYSYTTSSTNVSFTAKAWDIGGKAAYQGLELVGSYYDGEGIGQTGFLLNSWGWKDGTPTKRKSSGYYVQATYKIPTVGTKLGVSYGESNLNAVNSGDAYDMSAMGVANQQKSWVIGAYHPLTKSVNLVAEYTHAENRFDDQTYSSNNTVKTVTLGAIMFF